MVITEPPQIEVVHDSPLTTQPPEWTPEQLELIWQYQEFCRYLGHRAKRREVEAAGDRIHVKPSIRQVYKHFDTLGNLQRASDFVATKSGTQAGSRTITTDEALRQFLDLAKRLRRTPTSRDVDEASKRGECPSTSTYLDLYQGKFNNLVRKAKLRINKQRQPIQSAVKQLYTLKRKLKRPFTSLDIAKASKRKKCPSVQTVVHLLGSIRIAKFIAEDPKEFLKQCARADAIRSLQVLAGDPPRRLTSGIVCEASKRGECPSVRQLQLLFGSFNNALRAAGLHINKERITLLPSKREVLAHYQLLTEKMGWLPTVDDVNRLAELMGWPKFETLRSLGGLRTMRLELGLSRNDKCSGCDRKRPIAMLTGSQQWVCQKCYRRITGKSKSKVGISAQAAMKDHN